MITAAAAITPMTTVLDVLLSFIIQIHPGRDVAKKNDDVQLFEDAFGPKFMLFALLKVWNLRLLAGSIGLQYVSPSSREMFVHVPLFLYWSVLYWPGIVFPL